MKKRKPFILALVPVYTSLVLLQSVSPSSSFLFDISILSLPIWCTMLQYAGVLRTGNMITLLTFSLSMVTVLTGRLLHAFNAINEQILITSLGLLNIIFSAIPLLTIVRFIIKFSGKERVSLNGKSTEKCLKRCVIFMLFTISLNIFACHLSKWLTFSLFFLFLLFIFQSLSSSIYSARKGSEAPDRKGTAENHKDGKAAVSETHVYRKKKDPHQSVDNRDYIIREVEKCFLEEGIHLNPHVNEEMIASRIGTNVSYLSRAFNSHLNMSFKEFLHYHRIREACMIILGNPQIPNNEISTKCGYNVVCTFNNHFKRCTGKTPMEFKKEVMISNKDGKKQSRCIDDYLLLNIGYDEKDE